MKKNLLILLICLISATISSCTFGLKDKDLDKTIDEYTNNNKIEQTATFLKTEVDENASTNWEVYDDSYNTEDYVVKYVKYENTGGLDELNNYGQCDDILYPGALIDVSNPTLSVINLDQSPITMSISLEGSTKETSYRPYVMNNPCLSEARKGINKLVNNSLDKLASYPTRYSMSATSVKSSSEMNIKLGLNASYSGVGIKTKFDYSTEASSTSLVLVLKQIYYTIDIDVLKGASRYFSADCDAETIKKELDGKLPAVVSSVSYGRIAIVKLTSNDSMSSIAASLDGSYAKTLEVSASIDQKIENKEINSEIFIYGGSLSADTAIGTSSSLTTLIKEFNKDLSPEVASAVPISYRFRYISDSSLAKIQMANEPIYVKQYVQKKTAYQLSLQNMSIQYNDVDDMKTFTQSNPIVTSFTVNGSVTTNTLSSSEPTSKSETGSFSNNAKYAFEDNEINFVQNSLVIYNIDNERISRGELVNLYVSGEITIYFDIEGASLSQSLKNIENIFLNGPFGWISAAQGAINDFKCTINEDTRTLTMNYNIKITNYADIISTEGVTVDCSNGALTIRLKFDVNQL